LAFTVLAKQMGRGATAPNKYWCSCAVFISPGTIFIETPTPKGALQPLLFGALFVTLKEWIVAANISTTGLPMHECISFSATSPEGDVASSSTRQLQMQNYACRRRRCQERDNRKFTF
jgi:hypothetical protein